MPSYHAANVDIRLVSSNLKASTTTDLILAKTGGAKQQDTKVQTALKHGRALAETDIPCLGEKSHVHFLDGVPFLLVQAVPDGTGEVARTRHVAASAGIDGSKKQDSQSSHARVSSQASSDSPLTSLASTPPLHSPMSTDGSRSDTKPEKAQAGTTNGEIASDTTQQGTSKGKQSTSSRDAEQHRLESLHLKISTSARSLCRDLGKGAKPKDMKLETYLNGDLASCTFLPARVFTNDQQSVNNLSGRRVGRVAERAWILQRGSAYARLDPGENGGAGDGDAQERWNDIQRSLMEEVKISRGDYASSRLPSTQFLEELASLEMPPELANVQQSRGRSFGVLDLIITIGDGFKDPSTSSFVWTPTRPRDSRTASRAGPITSGGPDESRSGSPSVVPSVETARHVPLGFNAHTSAIANDNPGPAQADNVNNDRGWFSDAVDSSSPVFQLGQRRHTAIFSSPLKQQMRADTPPTPSFGVPHLPSNQGGEDRREPTSFSYKTSAVQNGSGTAVAPYCIVGSPVSMTTHQSSPDLQEPPTGDEKLNLDHTQLQSTENLVHQVTMSLGRAMPFMTRRLSTPARLPTEAPVERPNKLLAELNGTQRRRSNKPSIVSAQQRAARSPTSPKHTQFLAGPRRRATEGFVDIREATQEALDLVKSQRTASDTTARSSSQQAQQKPKANKPRNLSTELRMLGIESAPSKQMGSIWAAPDTPTATYGSEAQSKPVSATLNIKNSQPVTQVSSSQASTDQENPVPKLPPQAPSQPASSNSPPKKSQSRGRPKGADRLMAEQTLLSLEDTQRSIRARPRPSYEGMERAVKPGLASDSSGLTEDASKPVDDGAEEEKPEFAKPKTKAERKQQLTLESQQRALEADRAPSGRFRKASTGPKGRRKSSSKKEEEEELAPATPEPSSRKESKVMGRGTPPLARQPSVSQVTAQPPAPLPRQASASLNQRHSLPLSRQPSVSQVPTKPPAATPQEAATSQDPLQSASLSKQPPASQIPTQPPAATPRRSSTSHDPLHSASVSRRPSASRDHTTGPAATRQPFPIPELSRNSVLTYAEEGQQWEDGSGEFGLRQVRAERTGVFTEREVLLGVRYVVVDDGF